ncbi:MAG: HAD family hydrolase [Lachnospiraceae bacterium]|nr:HAD family hydrolase [Lachnospiraceae bacterium]
MNKAVFLDRDGTINVEKSYLYQISEFRFVPGALEALKILQDAGFLLIIITNQSGIARGYYTERQFQELTDWMLQKMAVSGIKISKVYYCPHLPDAKIEKYRMVCECRKPNLGMFQKAIDDYNISLTESFTIGDKIRDCAICEKTLCRGFLIGHNERTEIIDSVNAGNYTRTKYAESLLEAAQEICMYKRRL